jgi:hypothetical protein
MADQAKVEKKRTTYKPGNLLDFPEHLMDRAKYGYKWRSQEQLAALSDGYDPKHWQIALDKDGKSIKRGDLVLAQMPIDMYQAMKDHKDEVRRSQTQLLLEKEAAQFDRDSHEFRKKGGKVKFEFKQE